VLRITEPAAVGAACAVPAASSPAATATAARASDHRVIAPVISGVRILRDMAGGVLTGLIVTD